MKEDLKKYLEITANENMVTEEMHEDDSLNETLYENYGDELEDAYYAGLNDGCIELARRILDFEKLEDFLNEIKGEE